MANPLPISSRDTDNAADAYIRAHEDRAPTHVDTSSFMLGVLKGTLRTLAAKHPDVAAELRAQIPYIF